MQETNYTSPLSERYPSAEMKYLFSPEMKFRTWRKLWVALAESEMELGLDITQSQIDELKSQIHRISYQTVRDRTCTFRTQGLLLLPREVLTRGIVQSALPAGLSTP